MEGRTPAGLLLVAGNVTDPGKESEFNRWYNDIHIPDVTKSGVFTNATRYVNAYASGTKDDPRFFALYETERQDVAEAWAETAAARSGWAPSPDYFKAATIATFARVGDLPDAPTKGRTVGALLAMTDCMDVPKETEFNEWYDTDHAAMVVESPFYWSAYRYKNTTGGEAPQFLALYETDTDGPQAFRALKNWTNNEGRESPAIALMKIRHIASLTLIHSQARTAQASPA